MARYYKRRLSESRKYGRRRFLRESLSEEMKKQIQDEIWDELGKTPDYDHIPLDNDDYIKALSLFPHFKPETVTVISDPSEFVDVDKARDKAEEDAEPDYRYEGNPFGRGSAYADDIPMNKLLSSTDEATQYIIDRAYLMEYEEELEFMFHVDRYDDLYDGEVYDGWVENPGYIGFDDI